MIARVERFGSEFVAAELNAAITAVFATGSARKKHWKAFWEPVCPITRIPSRS